MINEIKIQNWRIIQGNKLWFFNGYLYLEFFYTSSKYVLQNIFYENAFIEHLCYFPF